MKSREGTELKTYDSKRDLWEKKKKDLKISKISNKKRTEGGGPPQFGLSHKLDPILARGKEETIK